jgi:hypothetical protein
MLDLGLFAYAIAGVKFISSASHRLQERLDLLLYVELTVDVDIGEIYRQIFATSENPVLHCCLSSVSITP